ncbi:sigma-70 family RNA polymerase sigma factor [Kribbella deserti]|uniref:Sigma-70 family RNA polymerase sigma factor n=1 Tax=Kribbella deserti TaxID=1926257 RepID=A0ABV6QHM3_9ACTN
MMATSDEFERRTEPHRGELVSFCYRMLGSLHDAEDTVQETYLRAWRGYAQFEDRSSIRTWLFRIATNQCLNLLQHSSRRLIPSAVGAPGDPSEIAPSAELPWLEPFPDLMFNSAPPDPSLVVVERQTLRLALVAALQHLPPRQRAALLLRDVLAWPAADVAQLLDTSTAAINSALQRARAVLAQVAPEEQDLFEPTEPVQRKILDQYAHAFEQADFAVLEELLADQVRWEMPPIPTWFDNHDTVLGLLRAKLDPNQGRRLVPISANGQPGFATYHQAPTGEFHAHALQVFTFDHHQIASVMDFHTPAMFPSFGLPLTLPIL